MKLADPRWRLNNLYRIVDKSAKKIKFQENSIQRRINDDPSQRKIILKARQFGVSTNCILDLLDRTIWKKNVTSCILAHEDDAIKKLFSIVRKAIASMDERLRPEIAKGGGSKYELYFPAINSKIYCDLESRGDTIHNLHVSECAFMDQMRFRSTLEAVPLSGRVTIETTPNGVGNFFYNMWTDPNSTYKKLFFPWFLHHEYKIPCPPFEYSYEERELIERARETYGIELTHEQIAFRRFKKQQSESGSLFIQEYPEDDQSCFLASGTYVMDAAKVQARRKLARAPNKVDERLGLKIYLRFDKSRRYVIAADVSEGIGGDYSVAKVFEVDSFEEAAEIRSNKWSPFEFAHHINELSRQYSRSNFDRPLLAVERNNHGHAVLLQLKENIQYPNLYIHPDERVGWLSDRVTRPVMIDAFIDGVHNGTLKINSLDTLSECLTLVSNNGKIEAEDGKHDDCVIASSIGLQLCISNKVDLYRDIDKKIRV